MTDSALTVRTITPEQHLAWIASRSSVSFLQLPQWGRVKSDWRPESLGWFAGEELVGAGLVLYRSVPRLRHRCLAYLPEGPDIDWLGADGPGPWLRPMLAHCRKRGAFLVKLGPPVAMRRWEAATLKEALAGGEDERIGQVLADWHSAAAYGLIDDLRAEGWTQRSAGGFGDVQPRYVFQLPLTGRSLAEIFAGFNQLWRRNIRKAEHAGVTVALGSREDLAAFHEIYVETAARDGFTPRALSYFQRMWDCLNEGEERLTLHLAHHEGQLAAATLMVRVGDHAWYSYGASTTKDREVRPSNALQWHMISRAHDLGCAVFDLRGITDTLDAASPLFGLLQFKLGTGGYAQEYVGEWDRVLRPWWARAYGLYSRLGR